jgi:GPH family glycoside/pentoside/hexuronide:cation symporter
VKTPSSSVPAAALPWRFTWREGWRYGLMGFPLAFVALPLYVVLPNYYARTFGVPLATLGAVLLGARLFDAFIDPWLGRWSDRLFARSIPTVLAWAGAASLLLGVGFALLFFPPVREPDLLVAWATLCLMLTYAAFSALSVMHQSWGAMLGGNEVQRSRVVAWREGLGLVGVLVAAVTPVLLGMAASTVLFFVALSLGWLAWRQAPRPASVASGVYTPHRPSIWLPFSRPDFRALLAVFMVNGIASAVPATLILFFIQDRLQAPPAAEPLFLGSFFLSAALAMPLWLRGVQRFGLARSWLMGMVLSMGVFVFAATLGQGDSAAFVLVCALSGLGLGADLALPGALLAGTVAASGDQGRAEGAYFGWWNFATKLNLALAAGISLPALGVLGYVPGGRSEEALQTLTWAYCLLPCALKALAAGLLYGLIIRKKP